MNCSRVAVSRPFKIGGEQRRQRADQAGGHHGLHGGVGDAGQLALQQVDEARHPFGARPGQHRFHCRVPAAAPGRAPGRRPSARRTVRPRRAAVVGRRQRGHRSCADIVVDGRGRTRRGRRSSRRSSARSARPPGTPHARSVRARPRRPAGSTPAAISSSRRSAWRSSQRNARPSAPSLTGRHITPKLMVTTHVVRMASDSDRKLTSDSRYV